MTNIELPRALEAYFAFAELPANERGRHFTINFTYLDGGRVDRLQWWWHVSKAQERAGEEMMQSLRTEAVLRFRQHLERWLVNSGRRLTGGEPFPQLETIPVPAAPATEAATDDSAQIEMVRECARRALTG
jgi:hypothetical protein